MAGYNSGRSTLALTAIAMGFSLGEIAIAAPTVQNVEVGGRSCGAARLTDCATQPGGAAAQTRLIADATILETLPTPPEPFLQEPIWIEPIDAMPLEPVSIDLEPSPLELFPFESDSGGDPNAPSDDPPIYHIVLVDLIDTATDAEIEALIADGEASIASIPGVLAVDIGLKVRDDRDVHIRDYDLGVYVKLDSTALDTYGAHPNHQAFIERQRHLWSSIRVIDFSGSAPSTPWNDCPY